MAYTEAVRRQAEAEGCDEHLTKVMIHDAQETVEQLRREHDTSLSFMRGETMDRHTRKAMDNDIKTSVRR